MSLYIQQTFSSFTDFVQVRDEGNDHQWVVLKSMPFEANAQLRFKSVKFVCKRGTSHRLPFPSNVAERPSWKSPCPAFIYLCASEDDLKIVNLNLVHNHD